VCVWVAPQFLKAGTEEPEVSAVTTPYKHICDLMPERWNSAIIETPKGMQFLGNGSLIDLPALWFLCAATDF
jgi:hypothetical protein